MNDLSPLIPLDEWNRYREFIDAAERRNLLCLVGGGLAFSAYSDRLRDTKDVDFHVLHKELDGLKRVLGELGFKDYFEVEEYDRSWIYRAYRGDTIIDLIWSLPNHRLQVDPSWFHRGEQACLHDKTVRLMPAEELIKTKLYVLQRDRSDWPDVLNIVHRYATNLDWDHLLQIIDRDARLLGALLNTYAWLCQGQVDTIPEHIWTATGVIAPRRAPCEDRAHVLDTRDWFGPGYTDRSQFKH
ncbi:MAG TPA: hypothetical protein VGE01_11935 [Fimbriimonas sp.]